MFNRNFTLGSSARADDKSLYANAAVTISQDIVFSTARTITVRGGNQESLSNWTINSPVHELSGAISGSGGLTINGADRQNPASGTLRISNANNSFNGAVNVQAAGAGGGGAVAIFSKDGAFGNAANTVSINSGNNGDAGMLMLEDLDGGGETFTRNITVAMGNNASGGDSGFGSWQGAVTYTGTLTITGARTTFPVRVQAGSLSFGTGSSIINNSTGAVQTYSKGGAGELVLDSNMTYAGTNPNLQWALRQGTITTTSADKPASGTAIFDGDNLIGNDGVTWPPSTGSIAGSIPVSRTWRVTSNDQSYTSAAMAFAGYTTVDVEAGRTLSINTGANPTSPGEGRGNTNTTPRWDLVKTGGGTWVFANSDLATPASSGPQNGAGFIRVDQGTLDITGDYGRGSLSVNGGTLLSGSYSPFTYSAAAGQFALGVSQTNLLEVTTAGGKIGISASASANVSRPVGFYWDQSGSSTLTLAARDNLDLIFATAANFPNVQAGNTLVVSRDGTGSGKVTTNDTAVTVAGTLAGNGLFQVGASGTGTLTVTGTVAPGASIGTLALTAGLLLPGALTIEISNAAADSLAVTAIDLTGATLDFDVLADPTAPSYILLSYSGTLTGNTNPVSGDTFATVTDLPPGYAIVHDTGLKQIRLESTGSTPYDTWAAGPFAKPFTNTAPGVDFDNDGIKNLMEFVLGGDPTISQPGILPTAVSASGSALVITFQRSDASELQPVAVKVQVSDDLATWPAANDIPIGATGNAGPVGATGASYTVDETGALDTIVVTIPKAAAAKRFARVVVAE